MGYSVKLPKDMWDSEQESHYTEFEDYDMNFEEVVYGVNIEFGNGDYVDEINSKLGTNIDEESVELVEVDTGDGSLYFDVEVGDITYQNLKVVPLKYDVEHHDSVMLEDIYDKDNSKLEQLIKEECGIE